VAGPVKSLARAEGGEGPAACVPATTLSSAALSVSAADQVRHLQAGARKAVGGEAEQQLVQEGEEQGVQVVAGRGVGAVMREGRKK
jgi:hypothetical protein